MHPLQEKFQVTVPNKSDSGEGGWADFKTARRTTGTDTVCLNDMPPGMDISDQHSTEQHQMPLSLAGRTDVSAKHAGPKALDEGYITEPLKGCDDQYTGEHVDHFYGDAGGFVERNNYLDRL